MKLYELFEDFVDTDPIGTGRTASFIDQRENTELAAEYIKKHCQPWLNESRGEIAWRGVNTDTGYDIYTRTVRKDRAPMSSSRELTEVLSYLIRLSGGEATRTNSLFVSGNYRQALAYDVNGLFATFPIGNFNYTYAINYGSYKGVENKPLRDWWSAFNGHETILLDMAKEKSGKLFLQWFKTYFKVDIIHNTGLDYALANGGEIMIEADKAVFVRHTELDRVREHLK